MAPYKNHHYVPQWYQKQFVEPSSHDNVLHLLDLKPEFVVDALGTRRASPSRRRRPIRQCFVEEDLYTVQFGRAASTAIEQLLFGEIDRTGKHAVDYWRDFAHPSVDSDAFNGLLRYMTTQKLRTPKGLAWLAEQVGSDDPNRVLRAMVGLQTLYAAIWSECVWQLADARSSDTKFIVTDHPVTVYNRECGPRNRTWCRGANDPDIRLHGTHTIFPLSLDTILILTNLSWARNPYQSAVGWRPNPEFFRDAVFNFFDVQAGRSLSEDEVLEINFIMKSRALRYIAASREEWLYPERHVSKAGWTDYGLGYLLMPDPRGLHHGGEVVLGYADGRSEAYDSFGRRPWQAGYGQDDLPHGRRHPLQRFQGEFARLLGPTRRGRSFMHGRLEDERDSPEFHEYHLGLERRRPASRTRR